MGHATTIMVPLNQLRLELENAEMSAKQEALAVGYANDRTCSLHVEMLDVENQHPISQETLCHGVLSGRKVSWILLTLEDTIS